MVRLHVVTYRLRNTDKQCTDSVHVIHYKGGGGHWKMENIYLGVTRDVYTYRQMYIRKQGLTDATFQNIEMIFKFLRRGKTLQKFIIYL